MQYLNSRKYLGLRSMDENHHEVIINQKCPFKKSENSGEIKTNVPPDNRGNI
jgi:hypothetical protein